jgi:hypothetical protein
MSAEAAAEFDAGVRAVARRRCADGHVRGELSARVVWGAPLDGGST